jgi:hypothetical protein
VSSFQFAIIILTAFPICGTTAEANRKQAMDLKWARPPRLLLMEEADDVDPAFQPRSLASGSEKRREGWLHERK